MKGRDAFTEAEAQRIRAVLHRLRTAERPQQKTLRAQLRAMGFYISDWDTSGLGFTRSDFDALVRGGRVKITGQARDSAKPRPAGMTGPARRGARPKAASPAPEAASLARNALAALTGSARRALADAAAHVPDAPGLYAIYGPATAWKELGLGAPPDDRPLYVGKAEDSLVTRDLNTHFGTRQTTGRSTVRRSIAALLRDTLGLRGIPRNPAKPERPANYGLSPEHEQALGEWMASRLSLAVWPKPAACASLVSVEIAVLAELAPPLNLKDNDSSWKPQVAAARAVMADDACAWARERGFKI